MNVRPNLDTIASPLMMNVHVLTEHTILSHLTQTVATTSRNHASLALRYSQIDANSALLSKLISLAVSHFRAEIISNPFTCSVTSARTTLIMIWISRSATIVSSSTGLHASVASMTVAIDAEEHIS